jgi:hypothetical protein
VTDISKLGQGFGQYMIQLISELFIRTGQPRSLSEMEPVVAGVFLAVIFFGGASGTT